MGEELLILRKSKGRCPGSLPRLSPWPAAQDSRWASQLLENHLGTIFTFPGELSQLSHVFPVIPFNSDTQGGARSLSFEAHWSISGFPGASVGEITNLNQNKNALQMR